MDFIIAFSAVQICAVLGFSIGFCWGEAFSNFDQQIKYLSQWFKRLSPFQKWFAASVLDAMHHFQYGLALMLAAMLTPCPSWLQTLLMWVGWGLVVGDWKDYQNVLRRLGLAKGTLLPRWGGE
jgi:hypothetical protein